MNGTGLGGKGAFLDFTHRKARTVPHDSTPPDGGEQDQTTGPRQLPSADPRVETGPVKFGDDWTGVFVRGDNALWYARALGRVLPGVKDPQTRATIQVLMVTLSKALRS